MFYLLVIQFMFQAKLYHQKLLSIPGKRYQEETYTILVLVNELGRAVTSTQAWWINIYIKIFTQHLLEVSFSIGLT